MAEDRDPRLVTGSLLDLACQFRADAALGETDMAELVDVLRLTHALQLVALRDDDDGEILAAFVPTAELLASVLDRDGLLGDQDHVRAAGDAAHHRNPA